MTVPPSPPAPKKKDHRVQIVVAVIGACAAILAALIPVVVSRFDDPEPPTPSPTAVAAVSTATPSGEDPPPSEDPPPVDETPSGDDTPSGDNTPPGPDPALAVPQDYRGSWSGQVDWRPPLQGSYSTTLTISAGSVGAMVGQFSVEGDTCRGALWLESGGGPIVLRLKTTYDGGGCSSLADVKLTLDDDGDLRYELIAAQFPQGFVNQPAPPAVGTLTQD
ncbi:hypothetical protein [Nonomuraea wenchangensis]|uniref:hypothetical protein n=1 Tax=Nonomuraea wenchangensis TaxID=568860 RepID=UPI0011601D95|nr:hypothetical protein [Nonomuraea wenchangensis]